MTPLWGDKGEWGGLSLFYGEEGIDMEIFI